MNNLAHDLNALLAKHPGLLWGSENDFPVKAVQYNVELPGQAERLLRTQAGNSEGLRELANLFTRRPGTLIAIKGTVPDSDEAVDLLILTDEGKGVLTGIRTKLIET